MVELKYALCLENTIQRSNAQMFNWCAVSTHQVCVAHSTRVTTWRTSCGGLRDFERNFFGDSHITI